MAPTTRRSSSSGSPIPVAGFMPPPAVGGKPKKSASAPIPVPATKKALTPAQKQREQAKALKTAAKDAEIAAKALLNLSKQLKKQTR